MAASKMLSFNLMFPWTFLGFLDRDSGEEVGCCEVDGVARLTSGRLGDSVEMSSSISVSLNGQRSEEEG